MAGCNFPSRRHTHAASFIFCLSQFRLLPSWIASALLIAPHEDLAVVCGGGEGYSWFSCSVVALSIPSPQPFLDCNFPAATQLRNANNSLHRALDSLHSFGFVPISHLFETRDDRLLSHNPMITVTILQPSPKIWARLTYEEAH